jgi:tetratricopeptide (TPR) repeat protein
MKLFHRPIFAFIGTFLSVAGLSCGEEPADKTTASATSLTVRDVWKMVFVDDARNYDQMISFLRKAINADGNSTDALTAKFLIGRIEIDRTEAEALNSYDKARIAFEDLSKNHPKTWQGQSSRVALLFLLQSEGKHAEAIAESKKAIGEIDWEIFGKNAPPDLIEYKKIDGRKQELSPDVLRGLIAGSYLHLKNINEAKKWIEQIDSEEMKKGLQEQLDQ